MVYPLYSVAVIGPLFSEGVIRAWFVQHSIREIPPSPQIHIAHSLHDCFFHMLVLLEKKTFETFNPSLCVLVRALRTRVRIAI